MHWPFCLAKCPYCDFNSHVGRGIDHGLWAAAYVDELDRLARETGGRVLNSVYFGGGTPSLMPASTVEAILSASSRHWRFANDVEITLEANPTSVEARRFADYRLAGVNRVSVGVQALNDTDLRALGRLHSVSEAVAALDLAARHFPRWSFDLIYARQGQSLRDWDAELGRAIDLAGDHLSLYQLSIERGTAFGARHAAGGLTGLPNEDLQADLYALTQALCGDAGLPAYEISNHARPGAESRHNMIYWRGGDWMAIGPGGHGRVTLNGQRFATVSRPDPAGWLEAVGDHPGTETRRPLGTREVMEEALLMGLRTNVGVELDRLLEDSILSVINELEQIGVLRTELGFVKTTAAGRPLLNEILRRLLAG